jgi:hypothetical protein
LTEIHLYICTCYLLDRFCSIVLLRPLSLPKLAFRPTSVFWHDPSSLLTSLGRTLLEFAEVLEELSNVVNRQVAMDDRQITSILGSLEEQMYNLRARIDERKSHPSAKDRLECEWIGADFIYYAILTHIIRSSPSVTSAFMRLRCLELARKALRCFRLLQQKTSSRTDFVDAYPSFINWTMLACPLSPFFIVFCNVVATSNLEDFRLLNEIANSISGFSRSYPALDKLASLFQTFVTLSRPLTQTHDRVPFNAIGPDNIAMRSSSTPTTDQSYNTNAQPSLMPPDPQPKPQVIQSALPADLPFINGDSYLGSSMTEDDQSMWNERLMWELFDRQPSVMWLENDIQNL